MSQTAHTPGPWAIVPAHQAINSWIVGAIDGDSIADCSPGSTHTTSDQATANAQLIAAAPELLEEGRSLIASLDPDTLNPEQFIAWSALKNACAKATGGQP